MTHYNSLAVKLSNLQLNKLKSAIQNETEVVLRLSLNMVSDHGTNFPRKLLLTTGEVINLRKAFANYLSTDIKLSKTQISKMIQSGGFLGRRLGPLLKTRLLLIKNVIKPLAKSVLIPLVLTAAASAAGARIYKKILLSRTTTLIMSNGKMKDIIKTVKTLEHLYLLLKRVSETIQNEAKEKKGEFVSMLLSTLGASLLGNILAGKGINRVHEGVIRTGYENKKSKKNPTKLVFNAAASFD